MRCFRSQESGVRSQKLIAGIFLLLTAYCLLPALVNAQNNRSFLTDKDQFNYAMFLYRQGHYAVSARELGRVIEYFPGSPVIPRAQYMMGDAYLNASMYREAASQFQQLIRNFPEAEFKAEASLKLEIARRKLKETAVLSFPKLPTVKAGPAEGNKAQIIMAVQVALFEGKNYEEVAGEMERLKAAGMDTIILRVFHNRNDRFNKDAVEHLERLFNDLAIYPLDGILFQDDLVLRHNEGFGPYAQLLFERDNSKRLVPDELYRNVSENSRGGYSVDYTDEFWRWAAWKNKRLLDIADRLRIVVKKKSPDVKFAINLMYESISNPPYAMAWLSQSLDEAVKQGFDYYAIMAYHQQMQNELNKGPYEIQSLIQKMTKEAVRLVGDPQKVIMKFQIIDWNTSQPLPDQEVIGLLSNVKEVNNVSLAVVPYRKNFPFEELGGQKKVTQLM